MEESIKQGAENYEPKTTKVISDLDKVSVDMVMRDDEYEAPDENDPNKTKKVQQKLITVEGVDYRIPESVLSQLKVQLKENSELKHFKVDRKGTGQYDTKYTVVPLFGSPILETSEPQV